MEILDEAKEMIIESQPWLLDMFSEPSHIIHVIRFQLPELFQTSNDLVKHQYEAPLTL